MEQMLQRLLKTVQKDREAYDKEPWNLERLTEYKDSLDLLTGYLINQDIKTTQVVVGKE